MLLQDLYKLQYITICNMSLYVVSNTVGFLELGSAFDVWTSNLLIDTLYQELLFFLIMLSKPLSEIYNQAFEMV
jgi:hypothetical protein